MASKFKKEIGQPEISNFISLSDSELTKESTERQRKRKHITPPSSEKPSKRLHQPDHCISQKQQKMSEQGKQNQKPEVSDSDESSMEEEHGEETAFERRLTKSLSKLMKKELRSVKNDVKALRVGQEKHNESINELVAMKQENRALKLKCDRVLQDNDDLKKRIMKIENTLLDNNIIIQGIQEDPWELDSNRMEKVVRAISYTVDEDTRDAQLDVAWKIRIKSTRRVGIYSTKRSRPISVTFERFCDADYVLQNRKYLPDGVYVSKEYNEETENNRRTLRPILRAARNNETYSGKCKLEGDTLIIKGLLYTVEDLDNLPRDLNSYNISSKTTDDKLAFFGELNPLSNFHKCSFVIDGLSFHSSEQYIQYIKANYFKDGTTAGEILKASTALKCKGLSRNIASYDHTDWNNKAKELCYSGIKAKFEQNQKVKDYLLETGEKTLVEAGYDSVWGTGIPLHSKDCLVERKWEHVGLLGEMLMDIRAGLRNIIGGNNPREEPMITNSTNK